MADYFSDLCFPLFGAIWQHYLAFINKQTNASQYSEVLGRGPEPGVLSKSLRASDLQAAVLEADRTV